MLKKIGVALGLVLVALVAVIATRPSTFRIVRSAAMAAPAEVVFAQIRDFHRWAAWSPWEKLDPGMKRTFGGSPSGVGATYSWTGNDQVGEGRMTIMESVSGQRIRIKLEFLKPWTATNVATFTLTPATGGTNVEWAMEGANDFMGKAFSLVMDMDSMVGADFEKGLAGMKAAAEREASRTATVP